MVLSDYCNRTSRKKLARHNNTAWWFRGTGKRCDGWNGGIYPNTFRPLGITMSELTTLELKALHAALAGTVPWKQKLREQIIFLDVISREDTGAGTFTRFALKPGGTPVDIPEGQ